MQLHHRHLFVLLGKADLAPQRHVIGIHQLHLVLARVRVALGGTFVVVERDAGRDDVNQRETVMGQPDLDDRDELRLVARERPRHERRAKRQREQHGVNGRLLVGLALLGHRADVGRRGELSLGEPVHAIVLEHVQHVHVAADGVRHLAEANGERVAVAGDADVREVAIGGVGPRRHRWHAAVHGVEAVRLLHEVRGGLGRAADAAHLGGAMRRQVELPERLDERRGHGVVPAASAQRRHGAFVVALGQAEVVGPEAGMPDRWLGDGRHSGAPARNSATDATRCVAVSGRPE